MMEAKVKAAIKFLNAAMIEHLLDVERSRQEHDEIVDLKERLKAAWEAHDEVGTQRCLSEMERFDAVE